jgi:hypothetical protein
MKWRSAHSTNIQHWRNNKWTFASDKNFLKRERKKSSHAHLLFLHTSFQVVQEYERAVIFRLGRLVSGGAKGPGVCVNISQRSDFADVKPSLVCRLSLSRHLLHPAVHWRLRTCRPTNKDVWRAATRIKYQRETSFDPLRTQITVNINCQSPACPTTLITIFPITLSLSFLQPFLPVTRSPCLNKDWHTLKFNFCALTELVTARQTASINSWTFLSLPQAGSDEGQCDSERRR